MLGAYLRGEVVHRRHCSCNFLSQLGERADLWVWTVRVGSVRLSRGSCPRHLMIRGHSVAETNASLDFRTELICRAIIRGGSVVVSAALGVLGQPRTWEGPPQM